MLSKMNVMVIPDTYCWVDSKSGAPKWITFLMRQYYPKWFWKAGSEKVKVVWFGWFNLYQMWNFKESQNIKVPGPDSSCASCYTQNGAGDTRMGSGDHLCLGWFKLHLIFKNNNKLPYEKFKFPSVYSESPQKTSLDTIWTSPNRDGHLTPS